MIKNWNDRSKVGDSSPKLLGYINAPIKLILAQCSTSSTGHYIKWHALLPPDSGESIYFFLFINIIEFTII